MWWRHASDLRDSRLTRTLTHSAHLMTFISTAYLSYIRYTSQFIFTLCFIALLWCYLQSYLAGVLNNTGWYWRIERLSHCRPRCSAFFLAHFSCSPLEAAIAPVIWAVSAGWGLAAASPWQSLRLRREPLPIAHTDQAPSVAVPSAVCLITSNARNALRYRRRALTNPISQRGTLDLYFWTVVRTVPSPLRCVKRMEKVQG